MPVDALTIDPVLARVCGAAMSVIFLIAAWHKLRDASAFQDAVANYRILPESLVPAFARLLPWLEVAGAAGLLFPASRTVAAVLLALLLVACTAAVAVNLARGRRDIDCGCGDGGQSLSEWLVLRNLLLLGIVWAGSREGSLRPLAWIDYLSVAFGTLALLGLYVSANQLMANHPKLMKLRN
ncbi:MAG: methylamine utilization protein MauE [Rhodocyclales bacterium]|nr:methylamine utilization protein MauE [Rhodocyclales bacterium]